MTSATTVAIRGLEQIGRMFRRTPAKWTRNVFARTKARKPCNGKDAYAFCSIGAIETMLPPRARHLAREALRAVIPQGKSKSAYMRSIPEWNDKQSRATTVANKFFKAAKHLKNTAHVGAV